MLITKWRNRETVQHLAHRDGDVISGTHRPEWQIMERDFGRRANVYKGRDGNLRAMKLELRRCYISAWSRLRTFATRVEQQRRCLHRLQKPTTMRAVLDGPKTLRADIPVRNVRLPVRSAYIPFADITLKRSAHHADDQLYLLVSDSGR